MKKLRSSWIIHAFALLHAATVIACTLSGIPDTLLLTALTMALAIIICFQENLTVEVTIISIVLVNILGYVLGDLGAQVVFEDLPPIWQHSLATFVVTELLGWSLYLFAHRFSPSGAAGYERKLSWKRNKWWLVAAVVLVFGLRVYLGMFPSRNLFDDSGSFGILALITVFALGYMIYFANQMQREASSQRTRRHQAEFRYMTLKHQVDPHFLFNSLNVLDSIVQEGSKEEASQYIHNMAGIYRYLMQHESKRLVPLADEIAFARNYRDLIHIRFPEGLVFSDNLEGRTLRGYVVPCTIQLLIENAVKHNAISPEKPLYVTLTCEENTFTVRNNRIPKNPTRGSTGIGLQYIRNQYRDLAGAEIVIEKTVDYFTVTVPLLEGNY